MLAYLSWHRPAADVQAGPYEGALRAFHRSLAHRPPSGFRGSTSLRAPELPWLAGERTGYEDWYLLDDWAALGVLEEAAVAHGHAGLHDRVAAQCGASTSSVYRLIEGSPQVQRTSVAVWVSRAPGHRPPSLEALLGDGMNPSLESLWRRCLGLGPAPELCLLANVLPAGVAPTRLPHGWTLTATPRAVLWHG